MFTRLSEGGKALAFYLITLALVTAIAIAPGASTEAAMLTPLLAVVVMLFVVTRDGYSGGWVKSLGLHRLGLSAWPVALLGPLLVLGTAYGVVWGTGLADFVVPQLLLDESARLGLPLWLLVPVAMVVIPIFTLGLLTSLGEEVGWRGYLLARLRGLGAWQAVTLAGVLHGAFHLPFMLLTPLYHAGGNQLIVVPMFLLTVTAVGMFLGYLRLRTDSVWPAVLAHSSHNVLWSAFRTFTEDSSGLATEYVAGESGVIPMLGYALLGAWLMYTLVARRALAKA